MAHRKVDVDEIIGDDEGFLEGEVEGGVSFPSNEVLETAARDRIEMGKNLLSRGNKQYEKYSSQIKILNLLSK